MVPTMQPPIGTWNPDVVRSNGANRQAEIFSNPAINVPGNVLGTTATTGTFIPNTVINTGIPTATINPFINTSTLTHPFINTTINPGITGIYPTTNPYLTTGTTCINPTLGTPITGGNTTLIPVCTTTIGSVVYRDTLTGTLIDSNCGPCCATVNPWTGTTTITPINTIPTLNNGLHTALVNTTGINTTGINNGIPFTTINPINTLNPLNTINPISTITPFGTIQTIHNALNPYGINGINTLNPFAQTVNPYINTVNPYVNTINPIATFLNGTRNIFNTTGIPTAIHGINTIPTINTIGNSLGMNCCTTTPFGINYHTTPFGINSTIPTINTMIPQTICGTC